MLYTNCFFQDTQSFSFSCIWREPDSEYNLNFPLSIKGPFNLLFVIFLFYLAYRVSIHQNRIHFCVLTMAKKQVLLLLSFLLPNSNLSSAQPASIVTLRREKLKNQRIILKSVHNSTENPILKGLPVLLCCKIWR